MPMNQEEEDNSFGLFKDVVTTAIQEKEKIPKWKKKLDAADLRVSFQLLVSEEDTFYVNLIINKGRYSINRERIEDYTIEIVADPVHLVGFVSKEYSILNMLLTGKWKIKRLLRYPFKSLFIANLLVYS